MALVHRDFIQYVAVRPRVVAERGQSAQRPQVDGEESGDRNQEEHHAAGAVHAAFFSSRLVARSLCSRSRRIRASASMIIKGKATAPITICESATSGAWKMKNISARSRP